MTVAIPANSAGFIVVRFDNEAPDNNPTTLCCVCVCAATIVAWAGASSAGADHVPTDDTAISDVPIPDNELERLLALPPEGLSIDQMIAVYGDQVEQVAQLKGLDLHDAAAGLRMQEPAGRMWELANSMTTDFGGSWIDWEAKDGPQVVVALTEVRRDADGVSALDEYIQPSGLRVRYESVAFSVSDLSDAARSLNDSVGKHYDPGTFVVWVDEPNNVIRVSGADAGVSEIETTHGAARVVSDGVDQPLSDSTAVQGGWDGGSCTMGFAVVSPDNQYAIPSAGHCDLMPTPNAYPGDATVTLGARIETFDGSDFPPGDPEIDRQIHVVPTPHTGSGFLRTSSVSITRGLATRVAVGASVFYYGQTSVNCGRPASQPITVVGFGTFGQILTRSSSPMAGGGNTWTQGDSGGPVWALNTAIAMITAGPINAGCTSNSPTNVGYAVGVDRQFTDVPGSETMKFMLQEATGSSAGFAAMGTWHTLDPIRVLDTRNTTAITAGATRDIAIPAAPLDLAGITANITVLPVSGSGTVTVYPVVSGLGSTFDTPTNVQLVRYDIGAAGVPGTSGSFRIVNTNNLRIRVTGTGSAHVIIDYTGSYSRATGNVAVGNGKVYQASSNPIRVYDSRTTSNPIGPGGVRPVQVRNGIGAPAGAYAVAVNIVAVLPSVPTHLVAYRNGIATPATSSVNASPGEVIARLVPVQVGTGDSIAVFNQFGSTHVIVDVVGWWVDPNAGLNNGRVQLSGSTSPSSFTLAPGESREIDSTLASIPNGPKWGTRAALINVRAENPGGPGFLVIHQLLPAPSGVSNVNYTTATSIANGAIAPTEDDGTFWITNSSSGANTVTVKVDITGWILD